METIRKVALAFPVVQPHVGRVTAGIQDYARQHGQWRFVVAPQTVGASLRSLHGWPGDGVIALINTPRLARAAREAGLPVVNISGGLPETELPRVTDDQVAVGQIAADHLLECGFRHFGYYGLRRVWFSQQRARGIVDHKNGFNQTITVSSGKEVLRAVLRSVNGYH